MSPPVFELHGVRQLFAGRTVLDIAQLTLRAGGCYALLGPNGSGKTTLLQILALLQAPGHGTLTFMGQAVNWQERDLWPLRRRVVLVDQQPIMFSTTVWENVAYGLKMRGVALKERQKIATKCLTQVGLGELAKRPARRLSGGETQRVALARALACSPEVLLLDEPTAGVDPDNQEVIEKIIREANCDLGMTILFSSHNHQQAFSLSREQIFLSNGKPMGLEGVNQFSGLIRQRNNRTFCLLRNSLELELKNEKIQPGAVMVTIDPEKVRIYPRNSTDHPALVSAKVLQMTTDNGGKIRVLLEMGVNITAILPKEQVLASAAIAGDSVMVEILPRAIRIAPIFENMRDLIGQGGGKNSPR